MVVVAGISRKINLPEKFLLMMLEFSDHFVFLAQLKLKLEIGGGSSI